MSIGRKKCIEAFVRKAWVAEVGACDLGEWGGNCRAHSIRMWSCGQGPANGECTGSCKAKRGAAQRDADGLNPGYELHDDSLVKTGHHLFIDK